MTEKKFLAQLNLYLDGEIDPVEAAELEHEILSNPVRRRTYNDYCRIHRATKLVCEQFRAASAANGTAATPPARTAPFPVVTAMHDTLGGRMGGRAAPRPFRVALFATGLAAACAAGVFMGTHALAPHTPPHPDSAPAVVVNEIPATPAVVMNEPAPAQPAAATFPAPFVPEVRQDPFVQTKQKAADPFALTPWATDEDFARLLPTTLPDAPKLKVDPRFQPASLEQDVGPKPAGERENRPFRPRMNDEKSSSTAPAEFGAQP